jgi:hypothetical protein
LNQHLCLNRHTAMASGFGSNGVRSVVEEPQTPVHGGPWRSNAP